MRDDVSQRIVLSYCFVVGYECRLGSALDKLGNRLVDFCTGELTGFANQDLSKFYDIIVTGQELS